MKPITLESALKQIAKLKKDVAYLRGAGAFHDKVIKDATIMIGAKGSITMDDWHFIFSKAQIDEPGGALNN